MNPFFANGFIDEKKGAKSDGMVRANIAVLDALSNI
jgi:hypothetical protein